MEWFNGLSLWVFLLLGSAMALAGRELVRSLRK